MKPSWLRLLAYHYPGRTGHRLGHLVRAAKTSRGQRLLGSSFELLLGLKSFRVLILVSRKEHGYQIAVLIMRLANHTCFWCARWTPTRGSK